MQRSTRLPSFIVQLTIRRRLWRSPSLSSVSFSSYYRAMSTSTPAATISLPALLSASVDLARQAGVIIKDIFTSGNLGAIDKANPNPSSSSSPASISSLNDPQTLADLASQRLIISSLAHAFPGVHIVGEEGELTTTSADIRSPDLSLIPASSIPSSLHSLPLSSLTLWVDPLDGTKEFTLGHTEGVTVLIGITHNGRAIAGVIGQPFTGNVVWGCEGAGVHGLAEHRVKNFDEEEWPTEGSVAEGAPDSRVVVTTRSHFTELLKRLLIERKPTGVVRSGGAGSKALLLVTGQVDCYFFPSPGLKVWDVVACEAIIKAKGGQCTDAWGNERLWDEKKGKAEEYQVDGGMIGTMSHHDYYILPQGTDIKVKKAKI